MIETLHVQPSPMHQAADEQPPAREAAVQALAALPASVRLARACLLFHRGGPWTPEDHATWHALTGSPLSCTRTLCDLARKVVEMER